MISRRETDGSLYQEGYIMNAGVLKEPWLVFFQGVADFE